MVVGRKTNPLPGTTSKGNILTNLMVITEVSVVFFPRYPDNNPSKPRSHGL